MYQKRRLNLTKVIIAIFAILTVVAGILFALNFFTGDDTNSDKTTEEQTTTNTESSVSFLAVGDNIGHERIYTAGDLNSGEYGDNTYDFLPLYKNVASDVKAADLAFINQESIIGGDDLGITGYPAFNSPEQLASDLTDIGFDVVNTATNHSLDAGYIAIENTISIWDKYPEVLLVGVNNSQEMSDSVKIIEREGISFAFVAYTYSTNGYTTDKDYAVHGFDKEQITSDITRAKKQADVVIVSAHWGDENSYEINALQTENAQLFADLGVDLVIGHHPHVIQPMEWVEGVDGNQTLVIYSLGNFISTMESVDNQLEGMVTMDFVKKDDDVVIENVTWTMLINHYESSPTDIKNANPTVYKLSDYTTDLQQEHYILKDVDSNIIEDFTQKTNEIIGNEFKIQ